MQTVGYMDGYLKIVGCSVDQVTAAPAPCARSPQRERAATPRQNG